jgi:hypothetical protein
MFLSKRGSKQLFNHRIHENASTRQFDLEKRKFVVVVVVVRLLVF